jgi:V/A-type H+-transporting ATPase subunit D
MVKLTKNALKAERDALQRFSRYLPTLQLKKQQLQVEVQRVRREFDEARTGIEGFEADVRKWIQLLDPQFADVLQESVSVKKWTTGIHNVAGVDTPVFESLEFETVDLDLFATPLWFDDVLKVARELVEKRLKLQLLQEQIIALDEELRITSQRVNLFEKVKIPEAKENIRTIQIFLGDQQTAAVARAKIAKNKTQALGAL